ncbi:MAG: helix-turn-helix transcriptional regulator [Clostridiales bacterium]|nr:helix-turn-helix transcriptional regulator [Clostridiales bacterium]
MKILFRERLSQLRKEKGLTQLDLATILHTTQRRISYLEQGKVEPDLSTLVALAHYFEVSTDYLIGIKEY